MSMISPFAPGPGEEDALRDLGYDDQEIGDLLEDTRADATPPGRTWRPVDLGPILRGETKPIEPSIGWARTDGLLFLYPGKEHSVIGEMEAGKGWFASACCAAELTRGNHVIYVHFEEADPTDTVGRLQTLGVPDDTIIERFHFVGPEEPVRPEWLGLLLECAPSLVVLDGVNEAMALHGQGIREEDGAAGFRRRLVKPWTAAGAAVLSADHVVKDRERQGRGPLGSVHKGNGLSGSLILLENAEPFGRGQRGRSHVFITKDRPGHLRRNGRPTKTPGKTFMGELVVDDTRLVMNYLELTIWAPAEPNEDEQGAHGNDQQAQDDDYVLSVIRELLDGEKDANVRNIRAKAKISNPRTGDALTRLELTGRIREDKGPKNARIFTLIEDAS